MSAGLNLTAEDLGTYFPSRTQEDRSSGYVFYPLEMVKAIAVVWLFCGLRCNEIFRLRVGCIRWQREDAKVPMTGEILPKEAVCMLDVPVNKTSPAFTKPVDPSVGKAITAWEKVRLPQQPLSFDIKTGEAIHLLFCHRGKAIGDDYINNVVIPMLCRKAGVPNRPVAK